ncbi:hypothetical protein [Paenibacillus radicis (ex Xue et al. 2023)]|uniref:Uncharacterized protein n=1 Tax=Paenibacillus radicis (ex Xue et al. 2023) TaxID=2972489 RepID=A0ABT1YFP1_9BACL|nr:hypothetical protein [Paenibacillus radicis (ex Xue et al. 2023)]MCR8631752.1 hypothetical protein [Paenibacillus radicis (ex Xue et al. 2023)]
MSATVLLLTTTAGAAHIQQQYQYHQQSKIGSSYTKEIDGNPHVNPAWISLEINLTGKTNSNIGDMDGISQNTHKLA